MTCYPCILPAGTLPLADTQHVPVNRVSQANSSRSGQAEEDHMRQAALLIRPLPHYVARGAVPADPHFAAAASGHGAAYFDRGAPDDLRIVPTHGVAAVRMVVVVQRFRCPVVHHIVGRRAATPDLKKILSMPGLRLMEIGRAHV